MPDMRVAQKQSLHTYGEKVMVSVFQTFDGINAPQAGAARVARLRSELAKRNLEGFLVPRGDEYLGEYVAPYAERLKWLTGFSGSAGICIVLRREAALFVDGRYTVQAAEQVDSDTFDLVHLADTLPGDWLCTRLSAGQRIGYDPWLHAVALMAQLRRPCATAEVELVACASNPVDAIWEDQPKPPVNPITLHDIVFSGQDAAQKLNTVQQTLAGSGEDYVVLCDPTSIAWLFNIRGSDIARIPAPHAYAIVPLTGKPLLFVAPGKLNENDNENDNENVRDQLSGLCTIEPATAFCDELTRLGGQNARIRVDRDITPDAVRQLIDQSGGVVSYGVDPCALPRATKNPVELRGARTAHQRDGVAVCRFLAWLDDAAMSGKLDEITAAKTLETFRHATGKLKDISFDTISAAGEHAALPHYRVTTKSNRTLAPNSFYLVDSGAQYEDGTTDITRTILVGDADETMRRLYTLVLKGHIAIATARFPPGTSGAQLDALARQALWQNGFEFDHGTGHGVGAYLSVHEGPQRIARTGTQKLLPGMIISNEPGYYREGVLGIRIENLVVVHEAEPIAGGDRMMHGFETLTLAPIDTRPIDLHLLNAHERDWLNAYHTRVREALAPELDDRARAWLVQATEPIRTSRGGAGR